MIQSISIKNDAIELVATLFDRMDFTGKNGSLKIEGQRYNVDILKSEVDNLESILSKVTELHTSVNQTDHIFNVIRMNKSFTHYIDNNSFPKILHAFADEVLRVYEDARNISIKKYIVVDIDGTISDQSHRHHHAVAGDWDKYNSESLIDKPIKPIMDLVRIMQKADHHIIFLTGRSDKYESITKNWLAVNGLYYGLDYKLIMRKHGDWRPDYVIKHELLNAYMNEMQKATDEQHESIKHMGGIFGRIKHEVVFILEDRNSVVKMWREKGYTCLQVADGDF